MNERERQLKYELDSDAAAQAARLTKLVQESQTGSTELPRASALISRMYSAVQVELEYVAAVKTRGAGGKYKNWLRSLPLDVAAVMSIRECIKQCTSPETHVRVQTLTTAVGKLLELEVRIRQAEKVNPLYMQRVHDQVKENSSTNQGHLRRLYNVAVQRVFKDSIDLELSGTDIMHIGKYGVDACVKVGLIIPVRGTNRNGTTLHYVLNPEVHEFLTSYGENDVRNVISKEESKMLCVPDPWTCLSDGGYLSLRRKTYAPLMTVHNIRKSVRKDVAAAYTSEAMPQVFNAVNYLQSVPFSVHEPTREAILRVWQAGGSVMGVPSRTGPVRPENPLGPEWIKEGASEHDLAIFNRWKRKVVAYYQELREWRGKAREVGGFIKSSDIAGEPIWFPMYFDKRGRLYYRGVPNPQGSDLAKAALHFHERKPLGVDGVFWLKVHIANCYGFDKERFADRARWTEQNWSSIERALDEPENHPDVWGNDAPWCMFSAAWELREAYRSGNPTTYRTGVVCHMDATCSGLQHFSALLRDPVGGLYVNLTDPNKCGPKQDIYARVAANTLAVIQRDTESTDEVTAAFAKWWLAAGIPRAAAKKPVMTYVYGATLRGTAEFLEEYVEKEMRIQWPDETQSFNLCMYAARKLFQGIEAAVPAAAEAMKWLKSIARQQPNGKRMTWSTPTGFIVQHDYMGYEDIKLKLNACGVQYTVYREFNEDTRPHAMQNAIAPNFVHALDASHLILTANAMHANGLCMVSIHDSFGTHMCDVPKMHKCIREEFVQLYSNQNHLGNFLWEVGGVGEAPTRGTLNLDEVLESEFFFC